MIDAVIVEFMHCFCLILALSSLGSSMQVGILTVSDRCTAGTSSDTSGPALEAYVRDNARILTEGAVDVVRQCVPDNVEDVQRVVVEWADTGDCDLILTTGFKLLKMRHSHIKLSNYRIK